MKVTKKLLLKDYDKFCQRHLPKKIPNWYNQDYRLRLGDCIYNYGNGKRPVLRKSVHDGDNIKKDLRGMCSLLSTHFYYFGEEPRPLPKKLEHIIRRGRKHLVFHDMVTITKFEKWISKFKKNKMYAQPQLAFEFQVAPTERQISKCAKRHLED
jgi:hypothetical protein